MGKSIKRSVGIRVACAIVAIFLFSGMRLIENPIHAHVSPSLFGLTRHKRGRDVKPNETQTA